MLIVLVPAAAGKPRIVESDGSLASLQRLVGGYIERVAYGARLTCYVDEEALLKAKPVNARLSRRLNRTIVGQAIIMQCQGLRLDVAQAVVAELA